MKSTVWSIGLASVLALSGGMAWGQAPLAAPAEACLHVTYSPYGLPFRLFVAPQVAGLVARSEMAVIVCSPGVLDPLAKSLASSPDRDDLRRRMSVTATERPDTWAVRVQGRDAKDATATCLALTEALRKRLGADADARREVLRRTLALTLTHLSGQASGREGAGSQGDDAQLLERARQELVVSLLKAKLLLDACADNDPGYLEMRVMPSGEADAAAGGAPSGGAER